MLAVVTRSCVSRLIQPYTTGNKIGDSLSGTRTSVGERSAFTRRKGFTRPGARNDGVGRRPPGMQSLSRVPEVE